MRINHKKELTILFSSHATDQEEGEEVGGRHGGN
jgi:hypothetical protein